MKHNNLFASVALFSELYNSESYNGVPEILAEFIKGAVVLENKYSFNSTELKDIMKKVYGFTIPESVLRTVLNSKFKDIIKLDNKIYHFDGEIKLGLENIRESVQTIDKEQQKILLQLFSYIEKKSEIKLSESDKNKIFNTFSHILMDNGYADKYSDIISAFIISNENDTQFIDNLNNIKEGLILYQGINFTADLNLLGTWNTELTIYLSTEHLFNCLGYNGELFKEIFDDFYKLVMEINLSQKSKKGKYLIELKYLEETKNEIDFFFLSAESIFKGHKKLDPSKEAMQNILKGSENISDIKKKQVKFYSDLKQKNIEFQSFQFDIDNSEFNVVDLTLLEELKQKSKEKNRHFDEDYCINVLKIFTKINTFRRGNNKFPFENVRHIYITENNFAKYLAHSEKVKFENYDISFAKDIDFIISKFWFRLKKGFNNKNDLPKSFDVVTKAKIIISSHIKSSLSKNYEKLHDDFREGKLTEDQALHLTAALREKSDSPEEINFENIDTSLDFLNDETILENFLREKTKKETLHLETLSEKENLELQLQEYKEKEKLQEESKKEKELLKSINNETKEKWKTYKSNNYSDMRYYLLVSFLTILPIATGILLKVIEPINNLITSIGNYQYIIWGSLILVFVIELQGRSYLFDKERVKNGWKWICYSFSKTKYKTHKSKKIEEFKREVETTYKASQ